MDPHGAIGVGNKAVLVWPTVLMLIVVIPVILMALFFSWHYRASNKKATYAPNWAHSGKIEAVIWTVPTIIVAILAVIAWNSSHSLDPYRPIDSAQKPVDVEVVAMDWKWLFIYPEYHVASVNELAMPVGRPVNFRITSQSVMNSFFIPRLGSQIYAMAGMQTRLSLIADLPGDYRGISANYSGQGFADMHFVARATDEAGFQQWIQHAQAANSVLSTASFAQLAAPSEKNPVAYYSQVDPNLFHSILMGDFYKAGMTGGHHGDSAENMGTSSTTSPNQGHNP